MSKQTPKLLSLLILAMLLNMVSQGLHESGHWAVYEAYRRGPTWGFIGLVQHWDTPPLHPNEWVASTSPDGAQGWLRLAAPAVSKTEKGLEAAGGPLASLSGAILFLLLAYRSKNLRFKQMALMLALLISFSMALYYLRSPMRTGGDESDLALQAGISRVWIELPFATAFSACLVVGLRRLNSWRERGKWMGAALIGSLATGLLANLADGLVRSQVDLSNPLFQAVAGVSLPVLITYAVILILSGGWYLFFSRSPVV